MGLIWTRGSVGVAQWLGFELYERVYFSDSFHPLSLLPAYLLLFINFSAYNESMDEDKSLGCRSVWRNSRHVNRMILLAALISGVNFATLYHDRCTGNC